MKTLIRLPALLLVSGACVSAQAQIYKCREAGDAILYSNAACGNDAETVAVMPQGSIRFQPVYQWDPQVEEDFGILAEQEQELVRQLQQAQLSAGQSPQEAAEVYALRRQLLELLKSVRRQKTALQARSISPEDGEELVPYPGK